MNDTTAVARNEQGLARGCFRTESEGRNDTALMPPVDVIEDSNGITLRADLPGVPKDKRKLHVEADVSPSRASWEFDSGSMEATYAEVDVPRFRRVSRCPRNSNRVGVRRPKNGGPTLRIPKATRPSRAGSTSRQVDACGPPSRV